MRRRTTLTSGQERPADDAEPWEEGPLDLEDGEAISLLGAALRSGGYRESAIASTLETDSSYAFPAHRVSLYARRVASPSPLNTLTKLFALGLPVPEEEAEAALEPLPLERLGLLGVLERDGDRVRSPVRIVEFRDLLLVYDPVEPNVARRRSDQVLGLNPSSATLAMFTVRKRVGSALDVGTGGGIQALLAAQHADRVVATDTSPRALNFAAFNARLNDARNIEFRLGSFFEPVSNERFDLVVCNPPYVISPDSRYVFRDSGLPGDEVSRGLLRRAPEHLTEGGFACLICSWAHSGGADEWSDRPRPWLEDTGCDAWLLRLDTKEPLTYADAWNEETDAPRYESTLNRWLAYYEEMNVEAITMGIVLLRRNPTGANWLRAEDLPKHIAGDCSDHILRVFAAQDLLKRPDADRRLLEGRLQMVDRHALQQSFTYVEGDYRLEEARVQLSEGLPFWGRVDEFSLQLLTKCDGSRPLRQVIAELAAQAEIEVAELTRPVLKVVRQLLALGFLKPAAR